tara:strand:- start:420 stop:926 length:507 start_codon:yes stop_codon:yes gene_type:complete
MNIAKRLFAIILSVVSIALVSSGSPERLVTYEFCDHLEINHVYKINEGTGETKLSMVQYVWWEWRKHILVPVLDFHTKQKTGFSKRGSGFAVREYVVVENNYLAQPQIIHTSISRTDNGWLCVYQDFASGKMRHVSFKWIITTHTLYDSELNNRDIVALEHRNKFIKR